MIATIAYPLVASVSRVKHPPVTLKPHFCSVSKGPQMTNVTMKMPLGEVLVPPGAVIRIRCCYLSGDLIDGYWHRGKVRTVLDRRIVLRVYDPDTIGHTSVIQ